MEKVVSLSKRRGFVYPGSEIYGGLANTFDFGPLGVELKNNIKREWWKNFVQSRLDVYGLDGGILLSPRVWEASGHVKGFIDVFVDCLQCRKRFRVDQLAEAQKCPECGGAFTEPRRFVPMFKTFIGPVETAASVAYLRPETAQAIFINFKNILDSFHPEIPFGIAQIGKAFRNEITLGNFIFRSLEFEQMEIEYFIRETEWERYFVFWKQAMEDWLTGLGVRKEKLRWRRHTPEELAHYSKRTEDLEYEFPFGVKELYGLAYRTDFDLRNHSQGAKVELSYRDPVTNERFYPHVIEPSMGVERTFLVLLLEAYNEEEVKGEKRVVLKLNPKIAPFKAAVFPLLANKEDLVNKAKEIYDHLKFELSVTFDTRGNIGKRYFAQDEIGTPWCVTVDFQTLEDQTVTVRDRDSMKQERIAVDKLLFYFQNKLR